MESVCEGKHWTLFPFLFFVLFRSPHILQPLRDTNHTEYASARHLHGWRVTRTEHLPALAGHLPCHVLRRCPVDLFLSALTLVILCFPTDRQSLSSLTLPLYLHSSPSFRDALPLVLCLSRIDTQEVIPTLDPDTPLPPAPPQPPPPRPMPAAAAAGIGACAGFAGSLVGLGGGFVAVPMMTNVLKLTQHQAHGTSLAVVAATGTAGGMAFLVCVCVCVCVCASNSFPHKRTRVCLHSCLLRNE